MLKVELTEEEKFQVSSTHKIDKLHMKCDILNLV